MGRRFSRFECFPHEDGTWLVWDHVAGEAATLDGYPLIRRERRRAESACAILTRIYEAGLESRQKEAVRRLKAASNRRRESRSPQLDASQRHRHEQ